VLSSDCDCRRGSISRLDGLSTKLLAILSCFLVALPPLGCGTAVNSPAAAGTSVPAALSALSCSNASMTESGSDNCTVTLTAAPGSGGLSVSLASSSAAVTVPATVVVPASATSAAFTATVPSVTTAQVVTLTASAGSVSKTFALQLSAVIASSQLTISPSNLAFGNVTVNQASTLPVTLTSTGMAPVTINSGTLTGQGYTMSGATFPVTLNPGLAVKLEVQFDPTAAGAAAGQLIIQSNSSTNATAVVSLSGTGENATSAAHQVDLSWNAPSSSTVPIVGYNIYRSTGSSSTYQLLNSSVDAQTTYVDLSVQSGSTYGYIVKSVDSSGVESVPSNEVTATVP
jgi:Abnormal spindle-like microcephaly-assoc'd, ASPM-SPD-2-Hydin